MPPQDPQPAVRLIFEYDGDEVVVLCPSNPFLSIAPITSLPGVEEALASHDRVIAVSPLVQGAALKGPADRMLRELGHEPLPIGVAGEDGARRFASRLG